MNVTPERVEAIHKLFCAMTGRELPLDLGGARAHQWAQWFQEGFTEDDLRLVVPFLRQGIREGRRNEGALKFVNLIADPLKFGDDLAQAKTHQKIRERAPKVDQGKEQVLRQSGRAPENDYNLKNCTPAGEAAFRELQRFKESL